MPGSKQVGWLVVGRSGLLVGCGLIVRSGLLSSCSQRRNNMKKKSFTLVHSSRDFDPCSDIHFHTVYLSYLDHHNEEFVVRWTS